MKLKTITLIAAIMFAITAIYSIVNLLSFLSLGSECATAMNFATQGIYILKDVAACLFFFVLYKNQK